MSQFQQNIRNFLEYDYGKTAETASLTELYSAVSKAAMREIRPKWHTPQEGKRACYFSAEFLLGRMLYSNLLNLELQYELKCFLQDTGYDTNIFEEIEDAALGNGGLGRLAACFLDSAATQSIPLDGYGIRYKYGLFKQYFKDGFQKEAPDDWERFGDPWSVRREEEKVLVSFAGQEVYAVPYDMPVIGYGGKMVNTLRLWQAEPIHAFDFSLFNAQKYEEAVRERDEAEAITSVLYPNDDTPAGKQLRLKQQYFFSSASLKSILREYKRRHGSDFSRFAEEYAIQLNDTHPTVSIPELLRLLVSEEGIPFDKAFDIVQKTFAYTNHTIMAEALEKWDVKLFCSVLPDVFPFIEQIDAKLSEDLTARGISEKQQEIYHIVSDGKIHMARLAIYATHSTNGVAQIHTDILTHTALKEWYDLYPERFNNKTNGITQRRWLALCNRELSDFITKRIGNGWLTNLDELQKLMPYTNHQSDLEEFSQIKRIKKQQLADYVYSQEHIEIDPSSIFDIQVKRLHEYKRQLLNAFSILDIYDQLKKGKISEFVPMTFLFGAKAAPGYYRAKGIIKFINEIARMIDADPEVRGKMRVVFVQNYNVSYAEKLIPAADFSEQISTAGTEASGTSNMKFMLNGAVTLGTFDGANVEIVEQAGEENNYIFGARVEDLHRIEKSYHPKELYEQEPRIRQAVDTLINGTLSDGGTGMFKDLYDSLLTGADWHPADNYYLLLDFLPYVETKLRANREYRERQEFARKCLRNTASSGKFSSDRTVREYADEIWHV